jgi:hypothetical protein
VTYVFDAGRKSAASLGPQQAIAQEQLVEEVNRLNDRERNCIQALYEKHIIGENASNRPSQETLSKWAGYDFDTTIKNTLSTIVKAGFLSNGRYRGKRGGYFLTAKGERAGQLLTQSVMTGQD